MNWRTSLSSIALLLALAGLSGVVISDDRVRTSLAPDLLPTAQGTFNSGLSVANDQIYNAGRSTPVLRHSIVEGGLPTATVDGGFNLSQHPVFNDPEGLDGSIGSVDDNLGLQPDSPAIDKGSSDFLPTDNFDLDGDRDFAERLPIDFTGRSRNEDGGSGAPIVDVGAYEFQASATEVDGSSSQTKLAVVANLYPNPTREHLNIEIKVASGDVADLDLYDILGRRVRTLMTSNIGDGKTRKLAVDVASLPSGLYFVRLKTKSAAAVDKFVVVH